MTVAENIKRIRKEKGLTQKQLGDLCTPKMAESTIRQYELGFRNPKLETIKKIADALDINIYSLLEITPEEVLFNNYKNGFSYYDIEKLKIKELVQFMNDNPEYITLFEDIKQVKKEDIEYVKQMLKKFKY